MSELDIFGRYPDDVADLARTMGTDETGFDPVAELDLELGADEDDDEVEELNFDFGEY